MTGGYNEHNRSNNTDLPITGCDVTVIMELGMIIISCVVYTTIHHMMTLMNLIYNNVKFIINYI